MIPFPNISPEIFSITIFGMEVALRWYALAYIIGLLLGWRIAVLAANRPALWRNNLSPIEAVQVEDLLTWVIVGVILGGRLGYVVFYQPMYFLYHPMEIVMIWKGGMAFHGGLAGVCVAAFLFFRRNLVPYDSGADLLALAAPAGLLLGRVANFINAELWGRPTDLPWGVVFPGEAAQACGQLAGLCARHPSQVYEAVLEGLVLGSIMLFLAFRRKALKKPGLITGIFFAGYGIARSLIELVRQPDAQFQSAENPLGYVYELAGMGITMGQILSLPMIAAGLFLISRARRRLTS
ncbi:MAG: prolipoprotein diacylglyceryl transferase [Marinovum sp.]|jgi:phosphatidylglycerol:prolipoprotein diacylglycerol transferase|nr:prolipoprotein diacylglyceryl transferase [Marinovum sp.]MBT6531897.1 prolipoprotein diacylglyceryl transferase [Marinovum sp.]MBT7907861.1 prolipoprotein diacylglyceryl transferase [Marinovum sp.]